MLNVWQCLYTKTKCPNSILILFSRPPPDPQRRSVGNIFPPLSAKLFCHPHKWTHITSLSSALTRKDSSSTYSNTCCHAIDLREWVSRGETTLWLWRLQLLNISDDSEESLRVKSRLWPFWESDLRSRSRVVVVVVVRQEVTQDASIVTRDKYKCTLDTRLVTSISTDKYK